MYSNASRHASTRALLLKESRFYVHMQSPFSRCHIAHSAHLNKTQTKWNEMQRNNRKWNEDEEKEKEGEKSSNSPSMLTKSYDGRTYWWPFLSVHWLHWQNCLVLSYNSLSFILSFFFFHLPLNWAGKKTRWNSTFYSIENLFTYKPEFELTLKLP